MCEIKHVDFYPSDWLEGTSELTLEERGMYITAVALISARGEMVTRENLHRVCGVHGRTFNAVLGRLLALGKLYEIDGKIGQKRAEKELKNARKRAEKWLKNLDNPIKPNGYDDRAAGNARAHQPPATITKNLDSSQASQDSSPACAREGDPPEEAGLAGLADFKISDEWKKEAADARDAAGQPAVDMDAEARKAEARWEREPPRNRHRAWLGWAATARPDRTNVIELHPRRSPEEIEAERLAGLQIARARMGLPPDLGASV